VLHEVVKEEELRKQEVGVETVEVQHTESVLQQPEPPMVEPVEVVAKTVQSMEVAPAGMDEVVPAVMKEEVPAVQSLEEAWVLEEAQSRAMPEPEEQQQQLECCESPLGVTEECRESPLGVTEESVEARPQELVRSPPVETKPMETKSVETKQAEETRVQEPVDREALMREHQRELEALAQEAVMREQRRQQEEKGRLQESSFSGEQVRNAADGQRTEPGKRMSITERMAAMRAESQASAVAKAPVQRNSLAKAGQHFAAMITDALDNDVMPGEDSSSTQSA